MFFPFPFHRIFTSFTGETPNNFLKRIRVVIAANKLMWATDKAVSEIGYECGFSSASSFSSAFRGEGEVGNFKVEAGKHIFAFLKERRKGFPKFTRNSISHGCRQMIISRVAVPVSKYNINHLKKSQRAYLRWIFAS